MSARTPPEVAVIGAGISGLSTAFYLQKQRPDVRVSLYERQPRVGGNIRTELESGFLIDAGPDSFLRAKPAALELCRDLGLESELLGVRADSRGVHVADRGQLAPLPEGLVMGAPTRLGPVLDTSLLSLPGKLRMLSELLLPIGFGRPHRGGIDADESISDFLARRFGKEAAERLAAPLLAGIYAGDPGTLSMLATFPSLAELETRFGSVIAGLIQARISRAGESPALGLGARLDAARRWVNAPPQPPADSPFLSFRRGMSTLVSALIARLEPGSLHLGEGVRGLERNDDASWTVWTETSNARFDAVVVATPAHAAAKLLPSPALARELSRIRYASTATVFLGFDELNLKRPLVGQGLVVPPGEGGILAATWVTNKWEGRAPQGATLLRAFVGGARGGIDVNRSSDGALVDLARFELERLIGPLGPFSMTRVFRHTAANPQPAVGHRGLVDRIRHLLAESKGLSLTGAAYDGVGIADCIRQGQATARALACSL